MPLSLRTSIAAAIAATTLAAVLPVAPARADAPDSAHDSAHDNKSTALALFEQGRNLLAQGDFDNAAAKFEAASRLLHTFGILFNLAATYEKLGRTASAWSTWREAGSVARSANRADDQARAEEHERALAPQLSQLTLLVPQAAELASLEVLRNGAPVPRPAWDSPLPVDPGEQTIDARAPGHRAQHLTIVVLPNGDKKTLTVPALELEPAAAPVTSPALGVDPSGSLETSSSPAGTAQPPSIRTLVGWIGAGVGVAVAAGGIVEWRVGQGKMDDAVNRATAAIAANDRSSYQAASADLTSGNSQRTAGFVLLGIGGGVAVAGAALALTAPRGENGARRSGSTVLLPWLAPTAAGIACSGRW